MSYRRGYRSASRWPVFLGLFILSGLAGLALAAVLALPHLLAVAPEAGAVSVSPRASLELTFDRPMDQASVENALSLEPAVPGDFEWDGNILRFRPRQSWPLESVVTVTLMGGRSQWRLPLLGQQRWSFTVGRERLVYIGGLTPNITLISLAPDDAPQTLTAEPDGVHEFTLSPDGGRVVYAAQRPDGGADLKIINIDGTGTQTLLACPEAACRQPEFSPDGRRVAYERQTATTSSPDAPAFGNPHVYVYTLETGAEVIPGDVQNITRAPHWLPDGRLSFYDAARQAIAVVDVATGAATYIPTTSAEQGTWSPDSRWLVYPEITLPVDAPADTVSTEGESFYSHLLQVTIATNALQNLSGDESVEDASPIYSPAGDWLAFARKGLTNSTWTPGRQLWLMRPDGSERRQLTHDPIYNHSAFAWNADNRRLAYMRFNATDNSAATEIWVMNVDGSGAQRLAVGGYAPVWLP